ncbi:MAG TPA: hypothetical protein VNX40_03835 [Mucilaginibacter sp.]|jgi:hypothetical protein|nr:hypothetical protein [Mucilaginibacter sp.]
MLNLEIWKIIVTAIIAVLSWIVAHRFNTVRDRGLKRRELITSHLINAYRILANDITRRQASLDRDLKLETFISELQLFGSAKQIHLTKKLTDDIVKGGDFYVDDLLNDLRDSLRKELNLSSVEGNVRWLRFDKTKFDKI